MVFSNGSVIGVGGRQRPFVAHHLSCKQWDWVGQRETALSTLLDLAISNNLQYDYKELANSTDNQMVSFSLLIYGTLN